MTRARIGLLALICLIAPCLAQAQGQGVGDTVGSGMGSVGNFSLGASTQQRQPRTLDKIVAVVGNDAAFVPP